MECKRCGNKDPTYFYQGSRGLYCRKCVSFKRILLDEDIKAKDYDINNSAYDFSLNYDLTKFQEEASNKTLEILKDKKDVLLYCVCGAGKTEIVVKSISYYLKQGRKVCYAISRKEVVIELEKRFKEMFKHASVISVYGNHHKEICGDLIVCTTHQLFRYYQTFDLLILDEVDAYPLSGNNTLMNIGINSCKGNIIYSTATLNNFILNYLSQRTYKKVKLCIRPSLKPLIVPKVIYNINIINYLVLYFIIKKKKNQCIVFCSSKSLTKRLYFIYKRALSCTYVYSDLEIRDKNIKDFKDQKYNVIFATTVLERGITIKNVDVVIVYNRKHAFDKSSIIQMSGRVGRSITNPYGFVHILSSIYSKEIIESIREIKKANLEYEMSVL